MAARPKFDFIRELLLEQSCYIQDVIEKMLEILTGNNLC